MKAALTVLLAFVASALGTWGFIDWLAAHKFYAAENDRTMHQGAVPQGGGTPVVAAAVGATLVFWPWSGSLLLLIVPVIGLAVISAINDRNEIPFPLRLVAHAFAALAAVQIVTWDQPILANGMPVAIDRLLVIFALVWFINLYNFMDGIDGIAGVETITIATGTLLVTAMAAPETIPNGLAFALIGAAAGFLVWNWHKARVFLGDAGSVPLGLMTGILLIKLAADVSLAAALIIPLYYLWDATWTLLKRLQRGDKIWQAHREHAYQRAARTVGSHSAVVVRIALCNAALVVAAVLALSFPLLGLGLAVGLVGLLMQQLEMMAAGRSTWISPIKRRTGQSAGKTGS